MPTIVRTEYIQADKVLVYSPADAVSWKNAGYRLIREPRYEDDPFVLAKPSKVMVTWIYNGEEITEDKKHEIIRAYRKYANVNISRFTRAKYQMFLNDLESRKIVARWSQFQDDDIYFYVR